MHSRGVELKFHSLTTTLHRREWLASQQNCLTPGKSATISHWIWGSIGPRASLEVLEDKNLLPWKVSNTGWFGPQPTPSRLLNEEWCTAVSFDETGTSPSLFYIALDEPEVLCSYIRTAKQMHGIYLYTLDFVYRSVITTPPVQWNFRYSKYTVNLLSK